LFIEAWLLADAWAILRGWGLVSDPGPVEARTLPSTL